MLVSRWIDHQIITNNAYYEDFAPPPLGPPPRRGVEPRPRAVPSLAAGRARELLLAHLDDRQREDYVTHTAFTVVAESGRRYLINGRTLVANVTRLDDGARLCAHCDEALPMDDHLLAQMLMLMSDEAAFLAIANRSETRRWLT